MKWKPSAIAAMATLALSYQSIAAGTNLPPNRWVELRRDPVGARRGGAIRYVPEAGAFFL